MFEIALTFFFRQKKAKKSQQSLFFESLRGSVVAAIYIENAGTKLPSE